MASALRLIAAAFAFALSAPLAAVSTAITPPPIAARAFALLDVQSGQLLAAASADERFEPASLTKLMSAYIVFDALRAKKLEPGQLVGVSERARESAGGRMYLEPGKSVAVDDLLRGLVVQSANDAAIALAEAVSGTEEAFVALMNRQAERLGLTNTRFANATGLPAPDHYASARDLAVLASALVREFPDRYGVYAQKDFTWNGIPQSNRNRLLWIDPAVDGMTTGFTEAAGYCIVASSRRGERRLVSVLMGARTEPLRTSEALKLLNFGFQAYETRRLYRKGQRVAAPEVFKGTRPTLMLGFDRDIWLTLPRSQFAGLQATLETRQPFVAPYSTGQKAGIMKLMRDSATVAEFSVVALEDVPPAGFLSRGYDTLRLLFR